MSSFSAAWLTLREPYDRRARNRKVLDAVAGSLRGSPSVDVIDLACGTGSNFRVLSEHLAGRQNWKLVDNDVALLAHAAATPRTQGIEITTNALDLNRDLEIALEGAMNLVTTSALLDLLSETWLERFSRALALRSAPFYATLSYDGRTAFTPSDTLDEAIIAGVNVHQRMDKGFGPALGPTASTFAIAGFEALGYSVTHGTSDWVMGPEDREIQTEILAGWASAAHETAAVSLVEATGWLTRRRAAIVAGRSSISVGHVDFFATPSTTR